MGKNYKGMRLTYSQAKNLITIAFVAVQLVLYAVVLIYPEVGFPNIAFLVVLLCVAYGVLFCERKSSPIYGALALVFTLCADFYLVLYDDKYTSAMLLFNVAQIFHAVRVYVLGGKRERAVQLLVRGVCIACMLSGAYLLGTQFDFLLFICVVYFTNLGVSMIFAMKRVKEMPTLAIGLLLFFFCDVCVWAANAANYMATATWLFDIINNSHLNFIWLFYIPSQVLLAISVANISLKIPLDLRR